MPGIGIENVATTFETGQPPPHPKTQIPTPQNGILEWQLLQNGKNSRKGF